LQNLHQINRGNQEQIKKGVGKYLKYQSNDFEKAGKTKISRDLYKGINEF
jgi:hypothetical protein